LIKFSNTRVKSRNAKQRIRNNPTSTNKKGELPSGVPRGGGGLCVYRGMPQKYFSTFTKEFLWLID